MMMMHTSLSSVMMDKIMDMGSMMIIMIREAWYNMQWCNSKSL